MHSPQAHAYMEKVLERARRNIPMARQLGIKIANGFDGSSSESHGQNARELVAMTQLGLTPIEAIRTATTTAAELMGWQDSIGTIEAGKYADVIAVTGDPLVDIVRLQKVDFVMKGGEIVKSELLQ